MNLTHLSFIFSSINRLDKDIDALEALSPRIPSTKNVSLIIKQARNISKKMRAQANLIQLYVAKQDSSNCRLELNSALQIFYGLQSLVRPEIYRLIRSASQAPALHKSELARDLH